MNTKPYNSYLDSNDRLTLEVGVAGFSEDELSVERVGDVLYVSGSKSDKPAEVKQFYNRGLSYRQFKDFYIVPVQWVITSAEYINGVLRIRFEQHKETVSIVKVDVIAKQLADKAIEKAANGEKR